MRFLIDLIENDQVTEGKVLVESMISDVVKSKFKQKSSSVFNIFEDAGIDAAKETDGTMEDPLLQPPEMMAKEYFFKRYTFEGHEVVMKKIGMGQNAPTVTYINGQRYEIFTTAKQAEKETQRYIKDGSYDKAVKEKEDKANADAQAKEDEENAAKKEEDNKLNAEKQAEEDKANSEVEAAAAEEKRLEDEHEKITESFQSILDSDRPNILTFNSGEEKIITVTEAYDALEILKLLNNENGINFLNRLSDSITSYQDTMDFFLDKVRKGIY